MTGYEGQYCESCNWHNFYFAYYGIDGNTDSTTGDGVKCQKGNVHIRPCGCIFSKTFFN